jgi:hypothetical protein
MQRLTALQAGLLLLLSFCSCPVFAHRSLLQDAISNSNGCLNDIPKCEPYACVTRNIKGVARWACQRCQGGYSAVVDDSGQDNIIQCGKCLALSLVGRSTTSIVLSALPTHCGTVQQHTAVALKVPEHPPRKRYDLQLFRWTGIWFICLLLWAYTMYEHTAAPKWPSSSGLNSVSTQ